MINKIKLRSKNLFAFIPLFIFFISLTSAAVDTNRVDDVFQTNQVIPYTKSCINNGTHCSSVASCNYTFYNLDSSIKSNNVEATNVGSEGASLWQFNISYTESGVYQIDMTCADGFDSGSSTFYAQVTGSGFNESIAFYLSIFGIGLVFIFLGFHLSNPPITILGSFSWVFLGLYILFNGLAGVKDATTTFATGIIVLGVAAIIGIKSGHEMMTE